MPETNKPKRVMFVCVVIMWVAFAIAVSAEIVKSTRMDNYSFELLGAPLATFSPAFLFTLIYRMPKKEKKDQS